MKPTFKSDFSLVYSPIFKFKLDILGFFKRLIKKSSFLGTKGKKSASVSKPMETGTTNDDVDYEWIPR